MSTSKARAAYHHGSLTEALVAGALELLREGGTEALSLRAAARRAGVSAAAPYRHFADKEALLAAAAAHGFRLLAGRLREADTAGGSPEAALIGQGVAYVKFACEDPALFRLMFGKRQTGDHPALWEAGHRAYAVLADRVAQLTDEATREDFTLAAWSLVHGLASLLVDGQLADRAAPADLAGRVTSFLLRSRLPPTCRADHTLPAAPTD